MHQGIDDIANGILAQEGKAAVVEPMVTADSNILYTVEAVTPEDLVWDIAGDYTKLREKNGLLLVDSGKRNVPPFLNSVIDYFTSMPNRIQNALHKDLSQDEATKLEDLTGTPYFRGRQKGGIVGIRAPGLLDSLKIRAADEIATIADDFREIYSTITMPTARQLATLGLVGLVGGALYVGLSASAAADNSSAGVEVQKGEAHKESIRALAINHFKAMKSVGDNNGYRPELWFRLVDRDNLKLDLSELYEEKRIILETGTESDYEQELQIARLGLNGYYKFPIGGPIEFGTVEGLYDLVLVDVRTELTKIPSGIAVPAKRSEEGYGHIVGGGLGAKLDIWSCAAYFKAHAKKVFGNVEGEKFGPSRELFKEVDNNPLVYGLSANIHDRLIFTYYQIEPEEGEDAQIYVAKVPLAINIGQDKKIVNAFIFEHLANYFEGEDQQRFTNIFWIMTQGNRRLFGIEGSYKTDGDWYLGATLPVKQLEKGGNVNFTFNVVSDVYKGFKVNDSGSVGLGVYF